SLHGVRHRLQLVSPRRSGRRPPAQLRGLGIAAARLEADPRYISGRDRTGNCTVRWPARAACRGRQSRRDKRDTHDTPRRLWRWEVGAARPPARRAACNPLQLCALAVPPAYRRAELWPSDTEGIDLSRVPRVVLPLHARVWLRPET